MPTTKPTSAAQLGAATRLIPSSVGSADPVSKDPLASAGGFYSSDVYARPLRARPFVHRLEDGKLLCDPRRDLEHYEIVNALPHESQQCLTCFWPELKLARYEAAKTLHRAIRLGEIQRQTRCEQCGSGFIVEAHHSDYSRPLEVVWLCKDCHNCWHLAHRRVGLTFELLGYDPVGEEVAS